MVRKVLPDDEIDANYAVGFLSFAAVDHGCLCQDPDVTSSIGKESVPACFALTFGKYCKRKKMNVRNHRDKLTQFVNEKIRPNDSSKMTNAKNKSTLLSVLSSVASIFSAGSHAI